MGSVFSRIYGGLASLKLTIVLLVLLAVVLVPACQDKMYIRTLVRQLAKSGQKQVDPLACIQPAQVQVNQPVFELRILQAKAAAVW